MVPTTDTTSICKVSNLNGNKTKNAPQNITRRADQNYQDIYRQVSTEFENQGVAEVSIRNRKLGGL